MDRSFIASATNVAATVAEEARAMLSDGIAGDVLQIEALVKVGTENRKQDREVKLMRLKLMERQVSSWLLDMGLRFQDGKYGHTGIAPTVGEFIEDAECSGVDLLSKEGFLQHVKRWKDLHALAGGDDDDDGELYDLISKIADARNASLSSDRYEEHAWEFDPGRCAAHDG
eukprot:119232-Karenia_brevis.AAC.1